MSEESKHESKRDEQEIELAPANTGKDGERFGVNGGRLEVSTAAHLHYLPFIIQAN
jgi:hypothetical protein